jgi:hypothetical protein
MARRGGLHTAVVTLVVCSALGIASSAPPAKTGPMPAGTSSAAGTILGTVWDAQNQPLPDAQVRLRNLTTGTSEATTRASQVGQFTFQTVEGGNYVLELVNEGGRVIAVGQMFSVAPGETVATFIRLGAKLPWFAGFFNNAAASAVSTAAGIGVTAVDATGQPVSPAR